MIELFEHNLKAYNAIIKAWKTSNRTCIIHATGTGKSLIISKNIEQNPNSKHLFISPSTFIFDEIKKHLPNELKNVSFQPYTYFMNKKKLKNIFLNLNYIYLDEFHRIGAEKWGEGVINILNKNNKAKVLGTSATHIRYLDNFRNMAEEIFENNIASQLSLADAIIKGIHKKPKYVTALYDYDHFFRKTKKRINEYSLNEELKEKELDRLASVEIDWNNSKGIDVILKKHLTVERKKIIVFCRNIKHTNETYNLLKPIFTKIFKEKTTFHFINSNFSVNVNLKTMDSFRENKNGVDILFSVNMLNEGLHIKGTDTCIFLRNTESPIIYFQQLGRVFHSGQRVQPMIIDLINNFKLSYKYNKSSKNISDFFKLTNTSKSNDINLIIDFCDEVKDFSELMDSFKQKEILQKNVPVIKDQWTIKYEEFKEFYNTYHHFPLQQRGLTELGDWFARNKKKYKNGLLKNCKEALLLEIRPDIFTVNNSDLLWMVQFNNLKEYYIKNKRYPGISKEDKPLKDWKAKNKTFFNKKELEEWKITLFNENFNNFFDKLLPSWEESFELFKEYYLLHKKVPSQKFEYKEIRIGKWLSTQKTKYKKGILKKEHLDKINTVIPIFLKNE